MFKHILIPTDGSELSSKAVQSGVALAKSVGAKVTGITVTVQSQVFADTTQTNAASEKYLGQIKDAATAAGVNCSVIRAEHEQPYQAIIDAASRSPTAIAAAGDCRRKSLPKINAPRATFSATAKIMKWTRTVGSNAA